MHGMRRVVPKSYTFKDPVHIPEIQDIYKLSEKTTDADTDEILPLYDEEEKKEVPQDKKPAWLVRGDLSETSSVDDMLQLEELTEDSILLNLRIRYKANLVYTYIGSILVAVNPYRLLPIYSDKHIKLYDGSVLGSAQSPHLFAIGNEVFTHLLQDAEDQCILVSGESGSGKTESVKLLLHYLAKVNASHKSTVTAQIVEATPILESFGNAKTIRNHNSSRVGKYLEIVYDGVRILGGRLSQYLLEKSRIVHQHYGERNFHIFYEFLAGISPGLREKLHLKEPKDYFYLNNFENWEIEGKSDVDDFVRCMQCFEVLRFTRTDRDDVFNILAAILHLGNIEYNQTDQIVHGKEMLVIGNDELAYIISKQLQINPSKLIPLLTCRFMVIRGEKVSVSLSLSEALNTRDALSKALYSQLFKWLVHRVNRMINPTVQQNKSIALLDIFGFENFRENSFEQLCINYANEQLQYLFNKTVFEAEQERYEEEGIKWESLEFSNNEETVDLFSLKPHGILRILDDESQFPKATDSTFLHKLNMGHEDNELYIKPKTADKLEFSVAHYAGSVTYSVRGFIQKNKDMLRADIVDLLCSSKNHIVSQVFSDHKESNSTRHLNKITGRITMLKPRTPTVAAAFHESLSILLEKISRCRPWFIRCLKPNTSKSAMMFDTDVISEQIKAIGILETAKIRSAGYPVHMHPGAFLERYEYLYRVEPDDDAEAKDFCVQILDKEFSATKLDDYQMGENEIFLREAFYQHLEQRRLDVVLSAVRVIEDNIKGILLRRRFLRFRKAAIKIQAYWRSYYHRVHYQKFKKNVTQCQANLRRRWQMQHFKRMYTELVIEREIRWSEADIRKELTRQELKAIIGLQIPTDLAMLYDTTSASTSVHSEKQIVPIASKIFTQNLGLRTPADVNNFIFSNFTQSHFQHHLFVAKREPINHPFLIKTREKDFRQAVELFKLILRFMYDAHMSEQKETLLGNYIIQEVLSSPSLNDELFVQTCVQMWAKHQSDVSREKISHLMSMCLSCLSPSSALYKYLLKFTSDHAFDGYKLITQHKLLRSHSVDYPTPRYYPPTLLEWQASRKRAKMALTVRLPRGNEVCCHVDSWTAGEDCARLALCACGLFENRHGWTVQLHDDGAVYELGGHDHVLDLIGEIEVPAAMPHNIAPFLVSVPQSADAKPRESRHTRDRPHRQNINRQPSFEFSEPAVPHQSDLAASLSSIRDNLRIIPKPLPDEDSGPVSSVPIPEPPQLPRAKSVAERLQSSLRRIEKSSRPPITNGFMRQNSASTDRSNSLLESNSTLQRLESAREKAELVTRTAEPLIKSHSRLNERPANVDHPGMARQSLMNKRYIGSDSATLTPRSTGYSDTTSYIPGVSQPTEPSLVNGNHAGGRLKKPPSVTFRDQVMHPISSSLMNERYANRQSIKTQPLAMSVKASLNSRYIDSDQGSLTPRKPEDYWNGLSNLETPRYPPPAPLSPTLESEASDEPVSRPMFSPQSSVQEAPITHQDIMSQINNEILGITTSRYAKQANKVHLHPEAGPVAKNVAKKKQENRLSAIESNGTANKSDISGSDLDDWVDKMFHPIIQNDSMPSLTNPAALQKVLKGNGDRQNLASSWAAGIIPDSHGFSALTDPERLRQVLKGEGGGSTTTVDSNNNNNIGDALKNGHTDANSSSGPMSPNSGKPFSYSQTSIPAKILKPPASLNNLNAPPSTLREKKPKRAHSPLGPTPWNMLGHASGAQVKANVNSKINNLAGRLIANVKISEDLMRAELQSTDDSEKSAADETPDSVRRSRSPGVDRVNELEASNDAMYDTDDTNLAVTKSGGVTRGKAPMKKKPFHWSSVIPDSESEMGSSVTVSPRSVVATDSDDTIDADGANANNSNNSPATEKRMIKSTAGVTQSSDLKRSQALKFRMAGLLVKAAQIEKQKDVIAEMEKSGTSIHSTKSKSDTTKPSVGLAKTSVSNDSAAANKSRALKYRMAGLLVKASRIEREKEAAEKEQETNSKQVVLKQSRQSPLIPSSSANKYSALSTSSSAPNLQPPRQVYWEQLKPGEEPVKVIIPSPKKKRRGAESAWTRLLVALKIMKPSISRSESSNSLKEGLTGWKKVRYIMRRYLRERRQDPTVRLLEVASREHREITEAVSYEAGRQTPAVSRKEDDQDALTLSIDRNISKAPSTSGFTPFSETVKPKFVTQSESPAEPDHKTGKYTWKLASSTSDDAILTKKRWDMVPRAGRNLSPEPTQDPGLVLLNALSRLRKTNGPHKKSNQSLKSIDPTIVEPVQKPMFRKNSRSPPRYRMEAASNHNPDEIHYHVQLRPHYTKRELHRQRRLKPSVSSPTLSIAVPTDESSTASSTSEVAVVPWLEQARKKLSKSPNKEQTDVLAGPQSSSVISSDTPSQTVALPRMPNITQIAPPIVNRRLSSESDRSETVELKSLADRTKKYAKSLLRNTQSRNDSREELLQKRQSIENMLVKRMSSSSLLAPVTAKKSAKEMAGSQSDQPEFQTGSEAKITLVAKSASAGTTSVTAPGNTVKFLYKVSSTDQDSQAAMSDQVQSENRTAYQPEQTVHTQVTPGGHTHPQNPYWGPPAAMFIPHYPPQYPTGYLPAYPAIYPAVIPHQTAQYPVPSTLSDPINHFSAAPRQVAQTSTPQITNSTNQNGVDVTHIEPGDLQKQLQAQKKENDLLRKQLEAKQHSVLGKHNRTVESDPTTAYQAKIPSKHDSHLHLVSPNGYANSLSVEISNPEPSVSSSHLGAVSDAGGGSGANSGAAISGGIKPGNNPNPKHPSILKHPSTAEAKRTVVSAIVENNPAYSSARYQDKIQIINSNNHQPPKQDNTGSVRFLTTMQEGNDQPETFNPPALLSPVKAASMNGAPLLRKQGKVVWPPVKEEEPREAKQTKLPPTQIKNMMKRVGKLLIEESRTEKLQRSLQLRSGGKSLISPGEKPSTSQLAKPGLAKSLAERLELLEKKIGARPPPDNPVVQRSLSLAFPETDHASSFTQSMSKSAPVTPVVDAVDASAPSVAVINGTSRQDSRASIPSPSIPSTPNVEDAEATINIPEPGPVNVVSEHVVNGVVNGDADTGSTVSDRIPVRSVYHLLAAVRTTLLDDDITQYLSYKDVPWWLAVRKEVFSPKETLSNPKTIDLIFYQIVRDAVQYPCVRIPAHGRADLKELLGNVTVKTMSSPNISREQKWKVIECARSWPFYFSRIFAVVGDMWPEVEFVAVCHDGLRFGRRQSAPESPSADHLCELQHILYEDISQIKVPKEDIFLIVAEHKAYKVYTPKAGVLANMINAYGIEASKDGDFVEATEDNFTCEPGYLSYKKGDIIKLKPDRFSCELTTLPTDKPGWLYGSFNGRVGSVSEGSVKPVSRKEIKRAGSFQDTSRSRHSSGMSEGEPSGSQSPGKFSMLEFSMMYFRENLDRYSTRPNEMGINSNIKLIENLKLGGIKRRKSFTKTKEDKLQRQESWSWKEQADMIKWTKTAIPASLLKLPSDQMNKTAVECFFAVQQFMGDQLLEQDQTDIDCAFRILKACHNCPELRDEIYCQLARQTTNNKSPQSQSCLRGWRLFTLVACWFSPSDVLKPFLLNYLQQNASDPSRPYHTPAHNCLQMLRKTIKYGGRKNVPSSEEVSAITDGKLNKRQTILLPGGIPFQLNISPSTVVQDIIDEVCAKLGVVSQMEQDEYTIFAMVETDNEYARLKREEYVMDVITEMRLQRKDCILMFERTSWYFPLRLESATFDYLDMMFSQCIPDYIDGYLLTLDHKNRIPAKQLDDIITIAALLYRAAGQDSTPTSLKDIDHYLPGPILSLGLLRHQQFLHGIQDKLERLINYNTVDCKLQALNMLRKWPLFGASFFNIQCLTDPKITGDCLLAVNRAGVHFLHHKTHRVILSYPFTEIISSRKISTEHKLSDEQFLDIKVGNNMVQKVLRVETSQGSDIAHLIGQYVKAVNNSAKLSS